MTPEPPPGSVLEALERSCRGRTEEWERIATASLRRRTGSRAALGAGVGAVLAVACLVYVLR